MLTITNITASAAPVQGRAALDIANEHFQAGRIGLALEELIYDLKTYREQEPEDWPAYARACQSHPICNLLHQDPFTYRAFAKPRGYAGDAVMMDYIYKLGDAGQALRKATPLGGAVFHATDKSPAKQGVRYRRRLIAELIDRVASHEAASVLAVAAGHLREVELSNAVQTRRIKEFVAFDQDEASLQVVAGDYARFGVRTIAGSVRQILSGKANPGQFDFVYAAGLFDYLTSPVAAALTRRMFDMTRAGGMMLIPNFLTGVRDRGYMEAFMDWHLIYRNHSDMWALASALPQDAIADCQVFDDPDDAITFLLVSKAN